MLVETTAMATLAMVRAPGRAAEVRRAAKWLSGSVEEGVIDRAVNGVGEAVREAGRHLRQTQSGQLHHYALAVVVGAILILGLYLMAG